MSLDYVLDAKKNLDDSGYSYALVVHHAVGQNISLLRCKNSEHSEVLINGMGHVGGILVTNFNPGPEEVPDDQL